jgi:primosomal protein N' (replication factor Y) (superfamily II helicase)
LIETNLDIEFDKDQEVLYIEVILPLPIPQLFTYRLPQECNELAVIGKRVFVPFGPRKVYTALIYNITTKAPKTYEALYVLSVIDDNPLITIEQLKFWQWIASYYMCSLGEVMAAALPASLKLESETFIALYPDTEYNPLDLDEREVKILEALAGKEKIKIAELETVLKSKSSFVKIIKSLYDRGLILIYDDVTEAYKPKLLTKIRLVQGISEAELNTQFASLETKAKKQYQALLALAGQPQMDAVKTELIKKYDLNTAAIKALIDKGLIEQYQIEVDRIVKKDIQEKEYSLTVEQQRAVKEITDLFKSKDTVLLHGATASGKTFVYIELIKQQIELGKTVVFLVPEIALTEQLIQRLEFYFSSTMAVSHSRFSKNEKVEIWNKASKGQVKLLVGPRSALFMPMQNLGLIIIDEEHETTFKQNEKAPRYHARDTAIVLAKFNHAKVLLGTATPAIETYYNALTGKFGLVKLPQLYGAAKPAEIVFADIKEETRTKQMHGIFTKTLFDSITQMQADKGQGLIFQNRKGYVPVLECSTCGWTSKCVNCDIALTYYKYSNNLRCHYCGYAQPNITKCNACGNHTMTIQGYGTERITEELELLMPSLKVIRFDQDSTKQKHAFKKLLLDFEQGLADVMVGTQILVKGLDFENVQLASVINADHILNFPDFRAYERTFQLLTQLAGRVGRHGKPGQMIIQTRQPEHEVLQAIKNFDYQGLYQQQIIEREQFSYPPFSRLIKLTLMHKDAEQINQCAAEFSKLLKQQLGARILGPEVPFVSKVKNYYLRNILVKMNKDKDNATQIKAFILKTYDYLIQNYNVKGLRLQADVDCY